MPVNPKTNKEQPFLVPEHHLLYCQSASPTPNRVITIERVFHAWCIYEYDEPLSRCREFMYDDEQSGGFTTALISYLEWLEPALDGKKEEPDKWTRAIDHPNGKTRVRRQRITPNGQWLCYDATEDEPNNR